MCSSTVNLRKVRALPWRLFWWTRMRRRQRGDREGHHLPLNSKITLMYSAESLQPSFISVQPRAGQDYFLTWFGSTWTAKLSQIEFNELNLQPLRHNHEAGVHFAEAGTKRWSQNREAGQQGTVPFGDISIQEWAKFTLCFARCRTRRG